MARFLGLDSGPDVNPVGASEGSPDHAIGPGPTPSMRPSSPHEPVRDRCGSTLCTARLHSPRTHCTGPSQTQVERGFASLRPWRLKRPSQFERRGAKESHADRGSPPTRPEQSGMWLRTPNVQKHSSPSQLQEICDPGPPSLRVVAEEAERHVREITPGCGTRNWSDSLCDGAPKCDGGQPACRGPPVEC